MRKSCCQSFVVFFCLIFLLLCAGCASDNRTGGEYESTGENPGEQRGPAPEGDPKWFLNGVSYDEESLLELIGYYPNLHASENLYFEIPEKCHLYRFDFENPKDRRNRPYAEEFYEAFHFFFPGHALDENYLFYFDDSTESGLNLLKDHEEEVLSDQNGIATFQYDERGKETGASGEPCVELLLGNPIGYGYAYVSKGKAKEIAKTAPGSEIYPGVYSDDPEMVFPEVGYYSPKSEQSFPLEDGEVRIRDAAAFLEKYMAELPIPKESDMEVKVRDVCVLQIGEGRYAYSLKMVGTFDEIPLDYLGKGMSSSSGTGNYISFGGNALMLESGDIDIIGSIHKKQNPLNLEEIQEGISLEKALSLLSERLTDQVDFEMERIEIVYRSKCVPDENGHINLETNTQKLAPWWRFTLYNANDNLTYVFYVDAAGGKLDYFTTRNRSYIIK